MFCIICSCVYLFLLKTSAASRADLAGPPRVPLLLKRDENFLSLQCGAALKVLDLLAHLNVLNVNLAACGSSFAYSVLLLACAFDCFVCLFVLLLLWKPLFLLPPNSRPQSSSTSAKALARNFMVPLDSSLIAPNKARRKRGHSLETTGTHILSLASIRKVLVLHLVQ